MEFIAKYKYFNEPTGYQIYGYIRKQCIVNIFTVLAKKSVFEVRALLTGDTNAQTIYYGSKDECMEYMKKFIDNMPAEELPVPAGVVSDSNQD